MGFGKFRLHQEERLVFVGQEEIDLLLLLIFDEMQGKCSPAHFIPKGNCPVKFQGYHVFESGSGIFDSGDIPEVDFALLLDGAGNFSGPGRQTEDQKKPLECRKPVADRIVG